MKRRAFRERVALEVNIRRELNRRPAVVLADVDEVLDAVVRVLLDLPKTEALQWRGLGTFRWHQRKGRAVTTPDGRAARVKPVAKLKFRQTSPKGLP